jgi:lipid-binding SYLF domain-containing protein
MNTTKSTLKNRLMTGAIIVAALLAAGCSTTASTTTSGSGPTGTGPISADKRHELDDAYRPTLERLYQSTPGSRELVAKARGVLIFPSVIQAGFVVGGAYGEGELRVNNAVDGYYRTTTGSIGWQIGAQSRALIFVFMTQDALDKFRSGDGWAGGVDASVAALQVGANGSIDVNAARAPTLAFVMTNTGLMANFSLEGTKVSRIQ